MLKYYFVAMLVLFISLSACAIPKNNIPVKLEPHEKYKYPAPKNQPKTTSPS